MKVNKDGVSGEIDCTISIQVFLGKLPAAPPDFRRRILAALPLADMPGGHRVMLECLHPAVAFGPLDGPPPASTVLCVECLRAAQ